MNKVVFYIVSVFWPETTVETNRMSIKLASLHNQLYNLSKIVVSHVDASLEDPKSISQIHEKNTQLEVQPSIPKLNANFDPVAKPPSLPEYIHNPRSRLNSLFGLQNR